MGVGLSNWKKLWWLYVVIGSTEKVVIARQLDGDLVPVNCSVEARCTGLGDDLSSFCFIDVARERVIRVFVLAV